MLLKNGLIHQIIFLILTDLYPLVKIKKIPRFMKDELGGKIMTNFFDPGAKIYSF